MKTLARVCATILHVSDLTCMSNPFFPLPTRGWFKCHVPIATRLSLFNCNRDNRRMPILRQTLPSAWIRHFEQPFAFNPFSFLCAIHFQLYSRAHATDRSLFPCRFDASKGRWTRLCAFDRRWGPQQAMTLINLLATPENIQSWPTWSCVFCWLSIKNWVGSSSWWFTV